ncbi:MAG: hypothetical protein VW443_12490, partial [Pseudomonadales bacterium]
LKVQIRFEATGDKELAKAFTSAANAQKKLEDVTRRYNKLLKQQGKQVDINIRNKKRLQGVLGKLRFSFATLRSQLLVYSFVFNFMNKTVGKAIKLHAEQQKATAKLNQTLRSTGFAAKVSSRELQGIASRLQRLTGVGDEAILSMQGILLTFTQIKGQIFKDATEAILNVSVAMGQDLQTSAVQVGKALNDPITGVSALQRIGIQFNDEQKKMIKNLARTNQIAKAQAIILKELEIQFGGTAQNLDSTSFAFNRLNSAFGDFLESGGGKLAPTFEKIANTTADVLETLNTTKTSTFNELLSLMSEDAKQAAAESMFLADIINLEVLEVLKDIGVASEALDPKLRSIFDTENEKRVQDFGQALKDNPNKLLKELTDQMREVKSEGKDFLSPLIEHIATKGNVEEILGRSGALGFGAFEEQFTKAADTAFADNESIMKVRDAFSKALSDGILTKTEISDIEKDLGHTFADLVRYMATIDLNKFGFETFAERIAREKYFPNFMQIGKTANDALLSGFLGNFGKSIAGDKGIGEFDQALSPFADILSKIFSGDLINTTDASGQIDFLNKMREAVLQYMEAMSIPIETDKTPFERFTEGLVNFKKENQDAIKGFDDLAGAAMQFSKGNKEVTISLLKLRRALAIANVILAFTEELKTGNIGKAFSVFAAGMAKVAQIKSQLDAAREAAVGA